MSITIEFVGGPRDGELLVHPEWVHEWRFERWNNVGLASVKPEDMARRVATLRGTYLYRVEQPTDAPTLLYDWQGWS